MKTEQHSRPETPEQLFPLVAADDVLMDARGYIIAEFCCDAWIQTAVAKMANTQSQTLAEVRDTLALHGITLESGWSQALHELGVRLAEGERMREALEKIANASILCADNASDMQFQALKRFACEALNTKGATCELCGRRLDDDPFDDSQRECVTCGKFLKKETP